MPLKHITNIKYKRFFFSVNDYFLSRDISLDADINYCIQSPVNIHNQLLPFYTLLIDLSRPVEIILNDIYHRTRSEINSFTTNQTFEQKILFPVPTETLENFIKMYNRFADEKKIRKAETYRLKEYNKAGILAVSYIQQNNDFLCINFYRLTQDRACNLLSFTNKKENGSTNSSQLGRAHRALHWLDILEFKNAGVGYYDFCGWYEGTTDENLLNINHFKEQFTKNKVKEYTGVIYKNKLLILLLNLFR